VIQQSVSGVFKGSRTRHLPRARFSVASSRCFARKFSHFGEKLLSAHIIFSKALIIKCSACKGPPTAIVLDLDFKNRNPFISGCWQLAYSDWSRYSST